MQIVRKGSDDDTEEAPEGDGDLEADQDEMETHSKILSTNWDLIIGSDLVYDEIATVWFVTVLQQLLSSLPAAAGGEWKCR